MTLNEKVVLIGAGSAVFTPGLMSDMLRQNWVGELALVDIDPEALRVTERIARKMIQLKNSDLRLWATTDRREALHDATVVISTIAVGGRRGWERDVFIPREFGIYQPVGDTVMPGGSSRALRMIPAMIEIACDVHDLAPEALFFNYANPMAVVCRAVRKRTGVEMVGLCHGVPETARYLANALGVPEADLTYDAAGMNHLTWFTDVRARGRSVMQELHQEAERRLSLPLDPDRLGRDFFEASEQSFGSPTDTVDNPFSWELFQLFGAFPAVLDRHVAEFFPRMFGGKGAYYGNTLGVESYSFEGAIRAGDEIFATMQEEAALDRPLPEDYFEKIAGEQEQVVSIIESIRRDERKVYWANLPNEGQVPNLPRDAIVECPAVADASGLRPIVQKPLPSGIVGTLATRFQWVETIAEAALTGDRSLFEQALVIDGSVDSVRTAERLAAELIEAHAEHLPQFQTHSV